MDINYQDIQKLKAFFQALKDINFKPNLYNIPLSVRTDCLGLLRKLPQFRGDEFKNDDILINTLIGYLKDPAKRKRFLADAGFSQDQQREFSELLEKEILEKQPELTGEQPSAQQAEPVPSAQQAGGGAPSTMIGGQPPRIFHPSIPRIPKVPTSDIQIGVKKGLTKVEGGFRNILGGVGRGAGGILSGIGSGGVRLLGGAGGALSNMGTQMTRSRGLAVSGKKFLLIFLGAFLLVGGLTAFAPAPTPGTQPTPGQPPQPSPGTVPSPSPSTYTPGAGAGILSCPINNGRITTRSKDAGGHCTTGYNFGCVQPGQPGYTGRDTAVDIVGSDRTIYLPYLGGQSVLWKIIESKTPINDFEGGGIAVGAEASYNGKLYRIRFVHIESTFLTVGQQDVPSATPVGQHAIPTQDRPSNANHVHITIQEDLVYKPADLYFNLCK